MTVEDVVATNKDGIFSYQAYNNNAVDSNKKEKCTIINVKFIVI